MPPGCRLGSRTTADAAHHPAGPSHQPGRQRPGRGAEPFVQSLLQQGESRKAPWWRRGALGHPAAACGCGEAVDRPTGGRPWGLSGPLSQMSGWSCVGNGKFKEAVCWVHRVPAAVGPIVPEAWLPGPGPQRLTVGCSVCRAAQQPRCPVSQPRAFNPAGSLPEIRLLWMKWAA